MWGKKKFLALLSTFVGKQVKHNVSRDYDVTYHVHYANYKITACYTETLSKLTNTANVSDRKSFMLNVFK